MKEDLVLDKKILKHKKKLSEYGIEFVDIP